MEDVFSLQWFNGTSDEFELRNFTSLFLDGFFNSVLKVYKANSCATHVQQTGNTVVCFLMFFFQHFELKHLNVLCLFQKRCRK